MNKIKYNFEKKKTIVELKKIDYRNINANI